MKLPIKRGSHSLKLRLILSLVGLVLFQYALMGIALNITQFYDRVDQQSVDMFYTEADQQLSQVNQRFYTIVQETVSTSQSIGQLYATQSYLNGCYLYNSDFTDPSYQLAYQESASALLSLMDHTSVTGVYYVLTEQACSGGYLSMAFIDSTPSEGSFSREGYELVVGSSDISKAEGLSIHSSWALYADSNFLQSEMYTQPLQASLLAPYGNLEQMGYWSFSGEDGAAITYNLPLLDELGHLYGVIGVAISADYFTSVYLSNDQLSYDDTFYAIGRMEEDVLYIDDSLPNDVLTKVYLGTQLDLTVEPTLDYTLYATDIPQLGDMFLKLDALSMYSQSSPFTGEGWSFLAFVPEDVLYQHSLEIKFIFVLAFGSVFFLSIIGSVLLSTFSTRRIARLSHNVSRLGIHDDLVFEPTHLREIDEMTEAVRNLSLKVIESSRTLRRIIELSELNLGGYEVYPLRNEVSVTDYISYLLGRPPDEVISMSQWEEDFARLTHTPVDADRNVYLYQIEEKSLYLKVFQVVREDGITGIVLDSTRDIEEALETKYLLDYDPLTNLYNRSAFTREATCSIRHQPDGVGALVFIDLDNLKYVNDTFGHDTGDLYIITASQLFAQLTQHNAIVARLSGDEFAIFLHGYTSKEELLQLIQDHFSLFKAASIPLPNGSTQRIRFSAGIAWYPEDERDIANLTKLADFAMYEAKHGSKGSLALFNRAIYDDKVFLMKNREAINQLIEEERVRFMFQPIVDLKTGEIYAFEALMRSDLPVFQSPLEILKVASAQFKLAELETLLIRKAIATAYDLREEIGRAKVFINSITSQSLSEDVYQYLEQRYGDFLHQLVVEITEAEDNTPEKMNAKVAMIQKHGIQLALDDFGSGYSNEIRMLSVNPQILKIDMDLLQGIAQDPDRQLLCSNIISYAHSKGIRIVAEGIETCEDLACVIRIGADYVQGYYTARPAFHIQTIPQEIKETILQLQSRNTHELIPSDHYLPCQWQEDV